jgi:copper homeostasis protein
MPGAGVRSATIVSLAEATGASEFHSSARVLQASAMEYVNVAMKENQGVVLAAEEEIKKMKEALADLEGDQR